MPDLYLTEQLETLERLCTQHPDLPETQHALRLVRRVHFHKQRGLTPLKRRYLLADLRAASVRLEQLEPKEHLNN